MHFLIGNIFNKIYDDHIVKHFGNYFSKFISRVGINLLFFIFFSAALGFRDLVI